MTRTCARTRTRARLVRALALALVLVLVLELLLAMADVVLVLVQSGLSVRKTAGLGTVNLGIGLYRPYART